VRGRSGESKQTKRRKTKRRAFAKKKYFSRKKIATELKSCTTKVNGNWKNKGGRSGVKGSGISDIKPYSCQGKEGFVANWVNNLQRTRSSETVRVKAWPL